MGLFKFIKRFFKVFETPIKDSKQSDKGSVSAKIEPSGLPKKPARKPFQKRGQRRPSNLTWQMHARNPTRETDMVIGFDFGTSCTKVVIQDSVLKKAYAVPFDGAGCAGNPYLLPTAISVDQAGNLSLNQNGILIDALKLKVLQRPNQPMEHAESVTLTAAEATSAYIGLVLREIRDWFWQEKSSDYQGVKIDWQLNIGMASRSYDDKALKNQMRRVALAGWNLTLNSDDKINVSDVKIAMATAERQLSEASFDEGAQQLHPDDVCPIPEIIAQVVGFARSPMRQDGMYLMVDVGASTIDVSNFIIHESDGEDLYTILVAEVEKLGASVLHKYRIAKVDAIISKYIGSAEAAKFKLKALKTISSAYAAIAPLPNIENHFPALPQPALRDYQKYNDEFMAECSRVVRKVLKESRFRRNPHSPAWQKGLPIFLCGGGSRIGTYRQIIPHAQERLCYASFSGFEQKHLPKPVNLETADIPPRDYHRMSVAYGLSFSSIDIGEIIPPALVDDLVVNQKIRNICDYYIDKDMV